METRPWGHFEVLGEGCGWVAKRLVVKPGCRLSYQRHKNRCEDWVVVGGRGRVRVNGVGLDAVVGDVFRIGREDLHRLENPGDVDLEVLEVQTGAPSEEDIERVEDDYGRVKGAE